MDYFATPGEPDPFDTPVAHWYLEPAAIWAAYFMAMYCVGSFAVFTCLLSKKVIDWRGNLIDYPSWRDGLLDDDTPVPSPIIRPQAPFTFHIAYAHPDEGMMLPPPALAPPALARRPSYHATVNANWSAAPDNEAEPIRLQMAPQDIELRQWPVRTSSAGVQVVRGGLRAQGRSRSLGAAPAGERRDRANRASMYNDVYERMSSAGYF